MRKIPLILAQLFIAAIIINPIIQLLVKMTKKNALVKTTQIHCKKKLVCRSPISYYGTNKSLKSKHFKIKDICIYIISADKTQIY